MLVPMSRGILATSTAKLAPGATAASVRAAFERAYADEPFVTCCRRASFPRTADTVGANTALIGLAVDEAAGRVVTITALDNLVKGTAGAAIQSANIALGLPESARPYHERSRTVSVTAAQGFVAAGLDDRPQDTAGAKISRSCRTSARRRRPRSSSPAIARRPTRSSGRSRSSPTASSRRSSSTRAAPTASRARRASRSRTRPPRRSPTKLGVSCRRRARLLDRPHRRPAAARQDPRRASRTAELTRRRWRGRLRGDHDDRLAPEARGRHGHRLDDRRHGEGRGHARARPRHDARRHHHGCGGRMPLSSTRASGPQPGSPSIASTPTAACRPTTRSRCSRAAHPALRRARTSSRRRSRGSATSSRSSCRRTPRAQATTSSIETTNAVTEDDAVEVGRSVARNNLFKAAVFGNDPNWGRVLAAIGTTTAPFDPYDVDVSMNGVMVCRAGEPGESRDLVDLTARRVHVLIDLKAGDGDGDHPHQRPHPRLRAREQRVQLMSEQSPRAGCRRQGRRAHRVAAVAAALRGQDRGRQVRRQRHGRRRPQARVRRRHGLPAPRRAEARRRARRRPADLGGARRRAASRASSAAASG